MHTCNGGMSKKADTVNLKLPQLGIRCHRLPCGGIQVKVKNMSDIITTINKCISNHSHNIKCGGRDYRYCYYCNELKEKNCEHLLHVD